MNKYQEALDELCSRCYVDSDKCTCHPRYEGGKCSSNCEYRQLLQELVDKEEPIKPVWKGTDVHNGTFYYSYCPKCNAHVSSSTNKYCTKCGQKIDWSELL